LLKALYGDHPYGRLLSGDWLSAIDPGEVKKTALRMRHPRNATLLVVGDIDVGEAEATVRRWFGGWRGHGPGAELEVPPAPITTTAKETLLVLDRQGVSQTEVTFACRLPPFDARAATVYRVLSSDVGSELFTRVREEAGAAYSVDGDVVLLR